MHREPQNSLRIERIDQKAYKRFWDHVLFCRVEESLIDSNRLLPLDRARLKIPAVFRSVRPFDAFVWKRSHGSARSGKVDLEPEFRSHFFPEA